MSDLPPAGPRPDLSGAQKKYLRGLAHSLKPVVRIGRGGLSDSLLESLDQALESHELVKVKMVPPATSGGFQGSKRELSAAIDERLGSVQAGAIGHVVIFYRRARDPEKRKIRLPT